MIRGMQVPKEKRQEAIDAYLAGTLVRDIAKAFDVAISTINSWIRQAGIKRRPQGSDNKSALREDISSTAIRADYDAGMSARSIAAKYRVSHGLIQNRLLRDGGLYHGHSRRTRVDPERLAELRRSGSTIAELTFIFGVSRTAIRNRLAQVGLGEV